MCKRPIGPPEWRRGATFTLPTMQSSPQCFLAFPKRRLGFGEGALRELGLVEFVVKVAFSSKRSARMRATFSTKSRFPPGKKEATRKRLQDMPIMVGAPCRGGGAGGEQKTRAARRAQWNFTESLCVMGTSLWMKP